MQHVQLAPAQLLLRTYSSPCFSIKWFITTGYGRADKNPPNLKFITCRVAQGEERLPVIIFFCVFYYPRDADVRTREKEDRVENLPGQNFHSEVDEVKLYARCK